MNTKMVLLTMEAENGVKWWHLILLKGIICITFSSVLINCNV